MMMRANERGGSVFRFRRRKQLRDNNAGEFIVIAVDEKDPGEA